MAKRKPVDLSQLRRDNAQADGLRGDPLSVAQNVGRSARPRRVEAIPLSAILPDRFQPRPLLPSWIRNRFFSGEINCYEAAEAWIEAAGQDEGIGARIENLLGMGRSFESHGQIKPITGIWQERSGKHIFVIETGERRFWASCLAAVKDGFTEEPVLQVLAVANPARERQVIENQHAETPTAVGRAREIAALILDAKQIYPGGEIADDYDYFRQAVQVRKSGPIWDKLNEVMGLTRPYMVRLLKVLSLPTHLLEIADNYQVPERVLRELLEVPPEMQEEALWHTVNQGYTHEDIQRLAAGEAPASNPRKKNQADPAQKAARKIKSILKAVGDGGDMDFLDEMAEYLTYEINDRARLEDTVAMLEALAAQLRSRLG